ncbi:hypothetical protein PG994_011383 [Apiospora phragmitis]|uniref:Secreted protein n=1 Tax=Apiospora phragmitis TaxID=2905665 RepID=A0ABR1TV85_9PEZI
MRFFRILSFQALRAAAELVTTNAEPAHTTGCRRNKAVAGMALAPRLTHNFSRMPEAEPRARSASKMKKPPTNASSSAHWGVPRWRCT